MNRIEKWTSECLEQGFKWLGKVDGVRSRCECMVCGHTDTYDQSAMRKGNVACSNCLTTKWSNECLDQGFKFIHKVDGKRSLCECLSCGHTDTYFQHAMRKGEVACSNCLVEKWTSECLEQGFKFIGKVDHRKSLAECMSCGHIDTYRQGDMRNGKVACSRCLNEKWTSECSEQGFKFIRKVDGNNSQCECMSCGHIDIYQQSHVRNGNVSCSNCSPGHWNEPCFFYIARIINGNSTIIKIGVADDPHKRYTQYGLKPDADITEILRLRFDTKLEAVEFESNMKSLLKPLQIHPDVAKLTLTYSGFTECYTNLAEDVVKDSFI